MKREVFCLWIWLLSVHFLTLRANEQGKCSCSLDGYTAFEYGACYCMSPRELFHTREKAQQTCQDMGRDWHLVTIHSLAENAFVNDYIIRYHNSHPIWIGLSDIRSEGVWEWPDISGVDYTRWYQVVVGPVSYAQPNGGQEENCVVMSYWGFWLDEDCANTYSYICKDTSKHFGIGGHDLSTSPTVNLPHNKPEEMTTTIAYTYLTPTISTPQHLTPETPDDRDQANKKPAVDLNTDRDIPKLFTNPLTKTQSIPPNQLPINSKATGATMRLNSVTDRSVTSNSKPSLTTKLFVTSALTFYTKEHSKKDSVTAQWSINQNKPRSIMVEEGSSELDSEVNSVQNTEENHMSSVGPDIDDKSKTADRTADDSKKTVSNENFTPNPFSEQTTISIPRFSEAITVKLEDIHKTILVAPGEIPSMVIGLIITLSAIIVILMLAIPKTRRIICSKICSNNGKNIPTTECRVRPSEQTPAHKQETNKQQNSKQQTPNQLKDNFTPVSSFEQNSRQTRARASINEEEETEFNRSDAYKIDAAKADQLFGAMSTQIDRKPTTRSRTSFNFQSSKGPIWGPDVNI